MIPGNDNHHPRFIHNIDKVQLVKTISPTQSIWNIHYTFPPPVSNRSFTVLQIVHLDSDQSKRTGYVIGPSDLCGRYLSCRYRFVVSLPIDLTSDPNDADLAKLEEKGIKGRYCSVERLSEIEDGKVEWRCVF